MTSRPVILVTGGAGYVGSHACKALDRAGARPVVLDNLRTGHRWAAKWGPLEVGDVRDTAFVEQAITRHHVTAVLHFAALSLVGESNEKPTEYYESNVMGTLSLVNAMRNCGVRHLVFSSTCAIYGYPQSLPITEDTDRIPVSVYGRTKLEAEHLLDDAAAAGNLDVLLLRYFNAAGADRDVEIGESHDPETHLIPLAIRAALRESPPLQVFGTDYPTPDGTGIRDYIHVEDLAEAHVLGLDFIKNRSGPYALNLGTGRGVSVFDILRVVEQTVGNSVPIVAAPRRPGDPAILYAATARAENVLDWTASRSDLPTIVETALRWHRNGASSHSESAGR